MAEIEPPANFPAQIANAIVAIPKGLTPSTIKAIDRLIGAAVDIPVAKLAQYKARIDAQTEAYKAVETAIAKAAASEACGDQETVQRAVSVLVRKEYRRQENRAAIAAATLDDLRTSTSPEGASEQPAGIIEDDWLNIFERYAEDASSERMQKLWGRVLAGEVRRPGKYSLRTLRFLSEFSQADALIFESLCQNSFGDTIPASLAKPSDKKDIRDLLYLEANGLINGASGMGLQRTMTFDEGGYCGMREDDLILLFKGQPGTTHQDAVLALTPLGQELVSLLPGRDKWAAARTVARAIRTPQLEECYLSVAADKFGRMNRKEVLWLKEVPIPPEPAL